MNDEIFLSVSNAVGEQRDIEVLCGPGSTVGELAAALVEAGVDEPQAVDAGPLTLLGHAPERAPVMLDPERAVLESGLFSGWHVRVTTRFGRYAGARIEAGGERPNAHLRVHRIEPRWVPQEFELPAPPVLAERTKPPLIAMLAPALLGITMFLMTGSAISLVMAACSPLLMVGVWIDTRLTRRRIDRRSRLTFYEQLETVKSQLHDACAMELAVRRAEYPALREVAKAVRERDALLWSREPHSRAFLGVGLGVGAVPSECELRVPPPSNAPDEHRAHLEALARDFAWIDGAPIVETLSACGSLGIVGDPERADGLARALMLQLASLHSPRDLAIGCISGPESAEWEWLKWLPHTRRPGRPRIDAGSRSCHVQGLGQWLGQGSGGSELIGALERVRQSQPVVLLVLPGAAASVGPGRLLAFAELPLPHSAHLIWVARHETELPSACRTYVHLGDEGAVAHYTAQHHSLRLSQVHYLDTATAGALARQLAPVQDAAEVSTDSLEPPREVELRDVLDVDLSGGAAAILAAWLRNDSVRSAWVRGAAREPCMLEAVVGVGASGPLTIDLRADGPHALVGGTTGSGKSEFLQGWIMGLSARLSPDTITFLLIDYKGGAAFSECASLPHTVGLVTDLDEHLAHRVLVSLRAELRRRERVLQRLGAKDLRTLESIGHPATPPSLVVVIDEFAALAAELPEFLAGVTDVAQRGRSLGLHLILATQRPAGVITENLRANTNLRIALRTADEVDSLDVLGVPDAAHFAPLPPGRGAVRVGQGTVAGFQAPHLSGPGSVRERRTAIEVHSFGFGSDSDTRIWSSAASTKTAPGPSEAAVLRAAVRDAFASSGMRRPRRPWLDPLPSVLDFDELRARGSWSQSKYGRPPEHEALIGLIDEPSEQTQRPCSIELDSWGNFAVTGAGGAGKSVTLLSLAASLSAAAAKQPVHFYAIDAGQGGLGPLRTLPTVCALARLADGEFVARVLTEVRSIVAKRHPGHAGPRVVLLIDGFTAFRSACESGDLGDRAMTMLEEIMRLGRAVGVHVALSVERAGAMPGSIASSVQKHLVLRLPSAHDYALCSVPATLYAQAPPGRGVLAGEASALQIAVPGPELERLGSAGITRVPQLGRLPERITLAELPAKGQLMLGIDSRDLAPVALAHHGLAVIAGPPGSGRTTATGACLAAISRLGAGRSRTLLSLSNARRGLARNGWDEVACGEAEVAIAATRLAALLGDEQQSAREAPSLVVVEAAESAQAADAVRALTELARRARTSNSLVVFEIELGSGGVQWELGSALKHPCWGIALQPDEAEISSLFRSTRGMRTGSLPPGRGFVFERGRVAPILVATS